MRWYHRLVRYPELWVLTVLALLTRLWQVGWPSAIVFDEVYFRTFAADYLSGHYFFDLHPPFVKLLFAGIGALTHLSSAQVESGDPGGTILRILPALAGAALVPLLYVILRQLRFSRRIATLGALFILCDNALLVESRFVLMDSLLLLAGFGAVSAYLVTRKTRGYLRWLWVSVMAILLGMLVSTKWTGLAIAGLLGVTWLVEGMRQRIKWPQFIGEGLLVLLIVAAIYIGSFMVHFTLLTNSGDGDAFMSQKFQSTLVGNPSYSPATKMSTWDKIVELNIEMYKANQTLNNTTHPYASRWYDWPFMIRGVYYWQGETLANGMQGNIYLLGNPLIWLMGTISVAVAFVVWVAMPRLLGSRRKLVAFLLAGYVVNFVPFVFINRPMFLYHYLFAFIISILLFCVLLDRIFDWQTKRYGKQTVTYTIGILSAAVILCFLYFLPLSYGWPLSSADLLQHMWLPTWR